MAVKLNNIDRKILMELLNDSSQPLESISKTIGLSKTPIWQRIRKMERMGVIKGYTAQVDYSKLGFETGFFVLIRTSEHEVEWQRTFLEAVRNRHEVLEAYRLAGDVDYILKVRVENAEAYDKFYQALISEVKIYNVTALLSMEEIKNTSHLELIED